MSPPPIDEPAVALPDPPSRVREVVSRDEVRGLRQPNRWRMSVDFGLVWLQAAAGVSVFAIFWDVPSFLVGALLVGSAQHGFGLIAHEGAHRLIVPDNRGLNDAIARLLFAAPVLLPFSLYRERHFAHHRLVSTRDDTKELYQRELAGWHLPLEVVRSLCGLDYFGQVVSVLRRGSKVAHNAPPAEAGARAPSWLLQEGVAIGAVQLALFAAMSSVDVLLYPLMWLLPNVTVAMLCSKIRSAAEHHPSADEAGTDQPTAYFKNTAAPFLRSVRASWLERVFISKINFHYHGEHHCWPGVSYQYLPILHERLHGRGLFAAAGIVAERTYLSSLRKLWAGP